MYESLTDSRNAHRLGGPDIDASVTLEAR